MPLTTINSYFSVRPGSATSGPVSYNSLIDKPDLSELYPRSNPSGYITGVEFDASLYVNKSGDAMSGKLIAAANNTSSKLNIGNSISGTSPASTANGDLWIASGNKLSYRSNSAIYATAQTNLPNTFNTNQILDVFTQIPALQITQRGAGEAFRVEDESSDPTPFIISSHGRIGIGQYPDVSGGAALSIDAGGIKFNDGSIQTTAATGYITNSQTGAFYAASNPSGYIRNTQTGAFYAASNPSGYIRNTQTGAFYAASNPSGFITGINLSNYVTTSQTGIFATTTSLNNLVSITGAQTISGIKTFASKPTVNGTPVLISGEVASSISRGTASVTTTSIAASGTFNTGVDFGCKSYGLLSVSGVSGAWVKLYYDTASRTSDATRTIDQDPSSNVSLIAESLSTGNGLIRFAPATIGYNEGTNNLVPIAITNTRTSAATYTIAFNFLKLEI